MSIPVERHVNMYAKGIQLWPGFVRKNEPQNEVPIPLYRIVGTNEANEGFFLPAHDKIMLLPNDKQVFSIEELNAYKWFKKRNISNRFTEELDKVWGVGADVPIRWPPMSARQNDPQDEWKVERVNVDDYLDEYNFIVCKLDKLYPKDCEEEFSIEEIRAKQRTKEKPKKQSFQKNADEPMVKMSIPKNTQRCCDELKLPPIAEAESVFLVVNDRRDEVELPIIIITPTKRRNVMNMNSATTPTLGDKKNDVEPINCENQLNSAKTPSKLFQRNQSEPMVKSSPMSKNARSSRKESTLMPIGENIELSVNRRETQCESKQPAQFDDPSLLARANRKRSAALSPMKSGYEAITDAKTDNNLCQDGIVKQSATTPFEIYHDVTQDMKRLKVNEKSTADGADKPRSLSTMSDSIPNFSNMFTDLQLSFDVSPSEMRAIYKGMQNECDWSLSDEEQGSMSIYVKKPEELVATEDEEWREVTQFLANATLNNNLENNYVYDVFDADRTRLTIDQYLNDLADVSPFDSALHKALLDDMGFVERLNEVKNACYSLVHIVHPLKANHKFQIGDNHFHVDKKIGAGNFGNIFSGTCTESKKVFAFKQERPPNLWEYYISLEVQRRIKNKRILNGFMAIDYALIGNNATIYASTFSKYGTLLDMCNQIKNSTGKNVDEYIVMVLAKQMLALVTSLHQVGILHCDIKPDNFLLMDTLSESFDEADIVLQLIDFGQSIDLRRFPKGQTFRGAVKTKNFICPQMKEGRKWSYHHDLFCLASTIYTILCGKYMTISKRGKTNRYEMSPIPRYYRKEMWTSVLDKLINIPSLDQMPSFEEIEQQLDQEIAAIGVKSLKEKIATFNKALSQ